MELTTFFVDIIRRAMLSYNNNNKLINNDKLINNNQLFYYQ